MELSWAGTPERVRGAGAGAAVGEQAQVGEVRPGDGRRTSSVLMEHAGAAGVYLLLALLLCWPSVTSPGTVLASDPQFSYGHMWMLRHMADSLLAWPPSISPWTSELGWPVGGGVVSINGPATLVWLMLAPLLDVITAYNVLMWLLVASSGWATFLLTRRLGARFEWALVAGLATACTPYTCSTLSIGEQPNLSHGLLALLLYVMIRVDEDPRPLWILPAAGLLALIPTATPYYAMFTALLLAIWAPGRLLLARGRRWRTLTRYAATALLAGVLVVPVYSYYDVLHAVPRTQHLFLPAEPVAPRVDDLSVSRNLTVSVEAISTPGTPAYLGRALLAAALLVTLLRPSWRKLGWGLIAGLGVMIMLGPVLYVTDGPWLNHKGQRILLPFHFVREALPIFKSLHSLFRAAPVAHLGLAVVLALGATELLGRGGVAARAALAGGVGFLLLMDVLLPGRVAWSAPHTFRVPTIYEELAADPDEYAILPLPGSCGGHLDTWTHVPHVFFQALHGKPIPWAQNTHASHIQQLFEDPRLVYAQPLYRDVCALAGGRVTAAPRRELEWFTQRGFGWIVLHHGGLSELRQERLDAYLSLYAVQRRPYPHDSVIAYRLPPVEQPLRLPTPPAWAQVLPHLPEGPGPSPP